jgi:ribokinase
MLSLCDLFISGREGYLEMTGEKDLPAAMGKLYGRYGCSDGVIGSAGSRGACWLYHGRMMEHKAFAIDAIDTTGAGDCFSAGIVFDHYYRGNSSEKSLLFASALAALKCTVRGPRSRADLSMVEDFIDSHNIERKE